jgi:hypothetical protein
MVQIVGPFNSGPAAGSEGSATNSQDSSVLIAGTLQAISVKYNPEYPDAPPATTKVTISTKGNAGLPALTILVLDGNNTDGFYVPRFAIHDNQGDVIPDLYEELPIYDIVNVLIESANEGSNVDVCFLMSD